MKNRIIKILNLLLIILIAIILLGICKKRSIKIKSLGEEESKVITSTALKPIKKVKAVTYPTTRITSSSERILRCIAEEVPHSEWLTYDEMMSMNAGERISEINRRKTPHSMVGGYYLDIPVHTFKDVNEFDFSGEDLGNLTLLPNFSIWHNLKRLDLSYCNITDVSGFTKSSYLKYITSIDLRGNRIQNPPISVVKDSRLNLRTQIISIDSGNIQKNSKLIGKLPGIFTKTYADLQPPKSYEKNINCKAINGAGVTLDTSKGGTHSASVKIADTNSRFYGSTVYFTYTVTEKGTQGTNKVPTKPDNNDNKYYQEPIKMTLKAESSLPAGYAKTKNITITLTGENVDVSQATIYVNNKNINNNNGKGVYTVNENGTYQIVVKYPGLDNVVINHAVDGIDKSKPTFTTYTTFEYGKKTEHLTIVGKDNCVIKNISVNGTNLYSYDGKAAYCQYPVDFKVTKSGDYKIKIVDMAGNTYEKTEKITIDSRFPHFEKISVTKEGGDEKVVFSSDVYDACRVKLGDKIIINIKPDEEIHGYKDIYLNGMSYGLDNVTKLNGIIIIEVELTQEIIDKYKMNGNVSVSIVDIKDKFGNEGTASKDKVFYLDTTPPEVKKVTLSGGTLSKNQQAIEIYKKQTITVSVYVTEQLNDYPLINVAGYTRFAIGEGKDFYVDGVRCYKYSVPITTDLLIKKLKQQGIENDFIPIQIKNWVDHAGHPIKEIVIDENNKSSNGLCLVYGKIKTGELFFAGTEETSPTNGDINRDGYINEYDYLLLTRHLSEIEELSERQQAYANIDGKDSIDKKDLVELENMIKQRDNEILKYNSVTLKVYDENNNQVIGENLKFAVEEGANLVTINNTEDSVTITPNGESGYITIRANYSGDNDYQEKIGKMKFVIGKLNSGNGAFESISQNKTNRRILGDVNKDGYVTNFDSIIVQKAVSRFIELTDEQKELADIIDDDDINILDVTAIQMANYYSYNGVKPGDKITLRFNSSNGKSYNDLEDSSIQNQIVWYTKENTDMVTINPNNNGGIAEITVDENAEPGTRVTIACRVKLSEEDAEIAEFNIEVVDEVEVNLTNKELKFDLSKPEENDIIIGATTNLSNAEITWRSSDETIVKVQVDEYGNAIIEPIKAGQAEIFATVDGVSESCKAIVVESIKEITVNQQTIDIKETQEEELEIILNPITATEKPIVISNNGDIAKVYQDQETGAHKVVGVTKGTTTIEVCSPSNQEIKQIIEVNVRELSAPSIKTITIEQEEKEKLYRIGEKLNIKISFTDIVRGQAPDLNIKFGNYASARETKFTGFVDNYTAITYEYTIQQGDNGILVIEDLEGGTLKDETGNLDAILTVDSDYYEQGEKQIQEQGIEEETYDSEISNEDKIMKTSQVNTIDSAYTKNALLVKASSNETEEIETDTQEREFISHGINKDISAVNADATKPTLTIKADVDKTSCWLKTGDIAKVSIKTSEELRNTPYVTMGGIEAEVEGEGTEFTASLLVTEDLQEGYLEIKVNGYEDLAGNEGEEVIAKEENIDEPIIIDYSGTEVESIELIKEKDKKYGAGDQFKIRIIFKDATIERNEYITSLEMPKINIKFGQNEAQGKLESNHKVDEYEDTIIYTYTISEKDEGKISIDGLSGTILDVAGNVTVLDNIEKLPQVTTTYIKETIEDDSQTDGEGNQDSNNQEESKEENKKEDKNEQENNKTDNKDDKKYFGKLPYAGASSLIIGVLTVVMTGIIVVLYTVKKKHLRIRIKFK